MHGDLITPTQANKSSHTRDEIQSLSLKKTWYMCHHLVKKIEEC